MSARNMKKANMTIEELQLEAKKKGYRLCKIPEYQCTCYMEYPNHCHKQKNGHWKCVDDYEPIKFKRKGLHNPMTRCRRKEIE